MTICLNLTKIYVMKRLFQIMAVVSAFAILLFAGCKKMDNTYQQFIKDGETIYIGKADSVLLRGGNNRIEVSWLLLSDPKVNSYKMYWNNRRDSVAGSVTKTENIDTVRVLLEDMPEGTHHFEIVMLDKYGHASVPTSVSGKVYGSQYEETLLNRTYRGMQRLDNDLEIDWMPAETTLIGVEVNYVNRDGVPTEHMVSNLVDKYVLPDFPENGTFEYRSLFLPEANALDTFYTSFNSTKIDERVLRGLAMSLTTEVQYGDQVNQLSILVSTDFDGIYEADHVNTATWVDVTEMFPLGTGSTATPWGPMDLSSLMTDNPMYVAFRYTYSPDNGVPRTWRMRSFEIRTNGGAIVMDQEEAQFQLVQEGTIESGRSSVRPNLIMLRGNSVDTESPKVDWAISKAID